MKASADRKEMTPWLQTFAFVSLCAVSFMREVPIGCYFGIGDCRVVALDMVEEHTVSGDADTKLDPRHILLVDDNQEAIEKRIWQSRIPEDGNDYRLRLATDIRAARLPFARLLIIQKRNGEELGRWEYLLDLKLGRARQRKPAAARLPLQRHRGSWLFEHTYSNFARDDTVLVRIDPAYGNGQTGALIVKRLEFRPS